MAGIARQLGTTWNTVWSSVQPLLAAIAADETRFDGVRRLGVDEHVWHHVSTLPVEDGGRGPKELTGMVDITPDADGNPQARLLDLVPGRSGKAYSDWLEQRGETFRDGVEVTTLDPFHGYKNAIDDQLEDATAVLNAFHVVKLGTAAVDKVRRRVQQEIHGHRGRKSDPLYKIRTILRCGVENLTDRQRARLEKAIGADERHDEVYIAWQCAQQLRSAYHAARPAEGRRIAEKALATFPTCPIPEIKRLGKTLKQWREVFLAYFDTSSANNSGTEAINGLIELHRRIARGFRNRESYRLRMLLTGEGSLTPTSSRKSHLSPEYLPVAYLYRYLRQGLVGGAVHHRAAVCRVEDRAVAGAGEVAVAVAHRALTMRADRRVRYEVAAVQVYQHRRLPTFFVGELEGRPLRHVRLLGDGRPALDLRHGLAAGLGRAPHVADALLLAGFATSSRLLASTTRRDHRCSGRANAQRRSEPDEPSTRDACFFLQSVLLFSFVSEDSAPHMRTRVYTQRASLRFCRGGYPPYRRRVVCVK